MEKYKKYRNGKNTTGFTLVEVLICVGIIGIIAAISIPAIIASTNEKALEVQRKALYSRISQAIGQLKNLNDYRYPWGNQFSANYFLTNGLSKVYKLDSICRNNTSMTDCGIPKTVYDYYDDTHSTSYDIIDKHNFSSYNSKIQGIDSSGYSAFSTINGESVLIWYNYNCKSKSEVSPINISSAVCLNMVYDLNGKDKAPNALGEDIGYITVFYNTDPIVVAPLLYNKEAFIGEFAEMFAKAEELDLMPPSREELASILINKNLAYITKTGADADKAHWSATYSMDSTDYAWAVGLTGGMETKALTESLPYYLIKK